MKNFIFLSLIIMFSCKNNTKEINKDLQEIDISKAFKKDNLINLSEICDKIDYIQLQTDSNCYINKIKEPWKNVLFYKDKIFINDNKEQLLCFDIEGNFITKIGKQGRGPGEFHRIDGFTILNEQNLALIFDSANQQLIFYSFENEFIKEIKIEAWPLNLYSLGNKDIVFECPKGRRELNEYYSLFIVNQDGELLNRLIERELEEIANDDVGLSNIAFFYNYSDTLTFWEYYYDIVYRIVDENIVIPRYYFNCGENKIPFETLLESKRGPDYKDDNYARVWRFVETQKYFFIRTGNNKRLYHILYNKQTKDTYNVHYKEGDRHNFSLINDLDCGVSFWPDGMVDKNRIFSIVYGYEIKNKLSTDKKGWISPQQKEQNNHLFELFKDCQITDNPILMIARIK